MEAKLSLINTCLSLACWFLRKGNCHNWELPQKSIFMHLIFQRNFKTNVAALRIKICFVYILGLIRLQQLFQAVNIGEITLDIDVKRVTDTYDAYIMLKDLHLKEDKENQRVFLDLATKKAEEIIVRIVSSAYRSK